MFLTSEIDLLIKFKSNYCHSIFYFIFEGKLNIVASYIDEKTFSVSVLIMHIIVTKVI